jgi:ATP-dependent DNA helicase RecG
VASLVKLSTIKVEEVSGLAAGRAAALRKGGISSVADLLLHVPRKYLDRSRIEPIALAPVGEEVTIVGRVTKVSSRRPRARMVIVEVRVTDGTSVLPVVFFNQSFRVKQLPEGTEVALSGKIERFRGKPQMNNPAVDILDSDLESLTTGRIVPIHPAVGVVSPGILRRAMHNALRRARPVVDPLPADLVERLGLIDRDTALFHIHFPPEPEASLPARRRLVFDEFFRLEVALALQKRRQMAEARGVAHRFDGELVGRFIEGLPYVLTGAQQNDL